MTGISSTDLARRSGLTYRQVDRWTAERVLHPTVDAKGSGSRRVYPDSEVAVVRILLRLRAVVGKYSMTVERLRQVAVIARDDSVLWVRFGADGRPQATTGPEPDGALYLSLGHHP
ncbi:MAG: MerR family transcriptional regulator [Acidimicrobiales bacterium]